MATIMTLNEVVDSLRWGEMGSKVSFKDIISISKLVTAWMKFSNLSNYGEDREYADYRTRYNQFLIKNKSRIQELVPVIDMYRERYELGWVDSFIHRDGWTVTGYFRHLMQNHNV